MARVSLRPARDSESLTPRTPLAPLRHFVATRYPDQYKPSCDYHVNDRLIVRTKRFLGQIVDERPIGELPDHFEVIHIVTDDFEGFVIGERAPIERMRKLERMYRSICNRIHILFTNPSLPPIATSRWERGLI